MEKKHISDLGCFKKVVCFPTSQAEWNKVSITEYGYNLTWACRFEINLYQAIDASLSVDSKSSKCLNGKGLNNARRTTSQESLANRRHDES